MNTIVAAMIGFSVLLGPAQDGLAAARQLYAAAAFDEALAAFNKLADGDALAGNERREAEEYRMFTLYALGRVADAEAAAETLVRRDPLARLESPQAPPRIRALYDGVRARLLPQLTRERYRAGRAALESKDVATAEQELTAAERLIDESEHAKVADSGLADLRVLVDGFLVLARAQRRDDTAAPALAAAVPARPPAATSKSIYSVEDADVIPPVVVSQPLPPVPPTLHAQVAYARRPMIVNLTIDEAGRVKKAEVVASVNRVYDRLVVEAAARWRYRPATRSGVPVTYLKALAVMVQ
jgi:TonB family protein